MLTSLAVAPVSPDIVKPIYQKPQQLRVVASVISVHGSMRTAKRETMGAIRKIYRRRIRVMTKKGVSSSTSLLGNESSTVDRECRSMEDLLQQIQSID